MVIKHNIINLFYGDKIKYFRIFPSEYYFCDDKFVCHCCVRLLLSFQNIDLCRKFKSSFSFGFSLSGVAPQQISFRSDFYFWFGKDFTLDALNS